MADKKEKGYVGFDKLKKKFQDEGKSEEDAGGLAAYIGRQKYGNDAFQKMGQAGKKKG